MQLLFIFLAAELMITLLSKALQLRNYFSADDEASVHQILLSCAHVSFATVFLLVIRSRILLLVFVRLTFFPEFLQVDPDLRRKLSKIRFLRS